MLRLDQLRSLADPLRQYAYALEIPNVPGGGDGETLSLRCTSTSLPGFGSEVTEVNLGGQKAQFAGRITFAGTFSVDIIEANNAEVFKTLDAWHQLQWNQEEGTQELSTTYKTDGYIKLLDTSNTEVLARRVEGMFIANLPDTPLDASSSEPIRMSIEFAYDRVHTE